jgi:membrane protease YdiL (CAAX protease family)
VSSAPPEEPRRDRPLWAFFALTFAVAWALWLASGVLDGPSPRSTLDGRWLVAQIGVFAPALSALLVSAFAGPRFRRSSVLVTLAVFVPATAVGAFVARAAAPGILALDPLRSILVVASAVGVLAFFSTANRRYVHPGNDAPVGPVPVGWLLAAALYLPAAFLLAWVATGPGEGGFTVTVVQERGAGALAAVAVAWCFNLVFGGSLGEELGWRGFALLRLLRRHGPLAASFLLAVASALWHAPIDLRYGFGVQGPGALLARFAWAWPLTIIFTFFFLRARGSLLAPLLLHTSGNALPDLGFSHYEQAVTVLFAINVVTAIVMAFALAGKPHWPTDVEPARAAGR